MNAPRKDEQAPEEERTLSDVLEDTYDELDVEEPVEDEVDEVEETDEAEAEAEDETAEVEEPAAEAQEEEPEAVVEEDYNEPPPERWPNEMKEAYANLTPNMKKALIETVFKPMQRQYTQTTQELAQQRSTLEPLLQTMNQYGDSIRGQGLEPAEAFRRQMAWADHFAKVGPEQGVKDMSAAFGLQNAQGQQVSQDEYMTPVERAMKAELDTLKQHLGQTQQTITQSQQQAQQQAVNARAQSIKTELQSFVSEQDNGKPAHPHVDKVGHAMAGLIRGGIVEKFDMYGSPIPVREQIKQAYTLACNMNPSIRSAAPRAKPGQVEAAKRANATVTSKGARGPVDPADRPIANDISDLYDQLARKAG